jgi:Universal stress protein family
VSRSTATFLLATDGSESANRALGRGIGRGIDLLAAHRRHPPFTVVAQVDPVDVVAVGARGRGGLRPAVLGSGSGHVVRNAPCPVLTVGNP